MSPRQTPTPLLLGALLTLGGVLAAPSSATAQSADVSGTWTVTFDQAIRTEGTRVVEVRRRGTAELRLEQRGDSIVGTWTRGDGGVTRPVSGAVEGDAISLASEPWTVRENGREMTVWLTWRGVIEDAEIAGEFYVHLGGRPAAARRWEAVRS